MILVETSNFKDSLLGLIGRDVREVIRSHAPPRILTGRKSVTWLIWEETARDMREPGGRRFKILLIARGFKNKIWSVGCWSRDFVHVLDKGAEGRVWWSAMRASPPRTLRDVNWVVRESGEFKELGVKQ